MNNESGVQMELKHSKHCLVTGAAGLCGSRLVEMLAESGAERIVAFDQAPRPHGLAMPEGVELEWVQGDLGSAVDVDGAVARGVDCVWHLGALTGPFYPPQTYERINYCLLYTSPSPRDRG